MKTQFIFSSDRESSNLEVFAQLSRNEMMQIRGGDTTTDGTDMNDKKLPE